MTLEVVVWWWVMGGVASGVADAVWRDGMPRIAVVVLWPIFAVRGLWRSFRKAWAE